MILTLIKKVVPGVVENLKIISEKACRKIARYAFEYCKKHSKLIFPLAKNYII